MDDARTDVAVRPVPPLAGTMNHRRATVASEAQHARIVERYERIHALRAKRIDVANIARLVGVSRGTVYRALRLQEPSAPATIHVARPYVSEPGALWAQPYMLQRWNEGCRNTLQNNVEHHEWLTWLHDMRQNNEHGPFTESGEAPYVLATCAPPIVVDLTDPLDQARRSSPRADLYVTVHSPYGGSSLHRGRLPRPRFDGTARRFRRSTPARCG